MIFILKPRRFLGPQDFIFKSRGFKVLKIDFNLISDFYILKSLRDAHIYQTDCKILPTALLNIYELIPATCLCEPKYMCLQLSDFSKSKFDRNKANIELNSVKMT